MDRARTTPMTAETGHTEVIRDVRLALPDGGLARGRLVHQGGRIVRIEEEKPNGEKAVDESRDWILPGLIDTHVHGAGGGDVMQGSALSVRRMARTLLRSGTTAFLATTLSAPPGETEASLRAISRHIREVGKEAQATAECLGVHLEGPFLSPLFHGAHPLEWLQAPNRHFLECCWEWSSRTVRIITLAPELPGAGSVLDFCRQWGVIPSAGHTAATLEEGQEALEGGIAHLTHAFNGMRPMHQRSPGLLGLALSDPRVSVELIADGVHVHPLMLRMTYRLKGMEGIVLVSDGTPLMGLTEAETCSAGLIVQDGAARLPDGTLAGGRWPLLAGVRTMILQAGVPLWTAVAMASREPARLLGVEDRLGSLEPGKEATFLRVGADFQLKEVWQRGELVCCATP
jgi:N-acetylglucosamine-6-phosphate deacetylase